MSQSMAAKRLAILQRALNGAMVAGVEDAGIREGVVLVLEGEPKQRIKLWADEIGRLHVEIDGVPQI